MCRIYQRDCFVTSTDFDPKRKIDHIKYTELFPHQLDIKDNDRFFELIHKLSSF